MRLFSLSKWRLPHLLLLWAGYWLALIVINLGPAIAAAGVATRAPGDNTSSVTLNWGTEAGISASVIHHGETLWAGATTIAAVIGWLVIPPLVLWIIWLRITSAQLSQERAVGQLGEVGAHDLPVRTAASMQERK
jgi:hypothetical protein